MPDSFSPKSFEVLCTRFHEESHYKHVPLDLPTCWKTYSTAKQHPEKVFLRELITSDGELVGLFIGSLVPIFFSTEYQAQDLIFYIQPEHRGKPWFLRTLLEFEKWAKQKGAFQVVLYSDTGIHPDKLTKLLERYSYIQSGICFNKEL